MNIHFSDEKGPKSIVIFAHGYKGFKDFGAWSLIADQFAAKGCVFIRFNFSFNGVRPENEMEFDDLDAFGANNYSIELADLKLVIDHSYQLALEKDDWNQNDIAIIGHSRGGGMAILAAAQHPKVKKLITWAAINSTYRGMPEGEELALWRESGVRYVLNGRTKQKMPHYFQFYEDLIANQARLNIEENAKSLQIPWLIIHGDMDEAVALNEALQLQKWQPNAQLKIIKNGSHTFGIHHPWTKPILSPEMQEVVDYTLLFILSN
jgi:pimeloyl-ACP methyl ester carboxylesterase